MPKIKLEPLTDRDAQDLYLLLADSEIKNAGITKRYSREQTGKLLKKLQKNSLNMKITSDNSQFMGIILVNSRGEDPTLEQTKELGFAIAKEFRKQYVATKAVQLVSEVLEAKGITELWASILPNNKASQKVLEANGFEYKYEVDFSIYNLEKQKYYLKTLNN